MDHNRYSQDQIAEEMRFESQATACQGQVSGGINRPVEPTVEMHLRELINQGITRLASLQERLGNLSPVDRHLSVNRYRTKYDIDGHYPF